MKIIRDTSKSFDLDKFLEKPLFAHLATIADDAPRESPVWYLWEKEKLWIIGTSLDSFPKRIEKNSKSAIGIVDFNQKTGEVLHAGFRGMANIEPFDLEISTRLLVRYLGPNKTLWDTRFQNLDNRNVLVCFKPETVVVRDQSFITVI